MIQFLIGILLGLVIVIFFIAVMYAVLPDDSVDSALDFFERLRNDLLSSTFGQIISVLLSPVVLLTRSIMSALRWIRNTAGPVAAFAISLIGLIRAIWGLSLLINPDKASQAVPGLVRSTVYLLVLAALGGTLYRIATLFQSLFYASAFPVAAKRPRKKTTINTGRIIRVSYIVSIIIVTLLGIHIAAEAAEIIRPNSRVSEILQELDLIEKIYLYVIQDIEIR